MNLGELTQHPDYRLLLNEMNKKVDNCTQVVVASASSKDLGEIRRAAGGLLAVTSIRDDLVKAKKKAG